jgi:hypothetical protein
MSGSLKSKAIRDCPVNVCGIFSRTAPAATCAPALFFTTKRGPHATLSSASDPCLVGRRANFYFLHTCNVDELAEACGLCVLSHLRHSLLAILQQNPLILVILEFIQLIHIHVFKGLALL